MSFKEEIDIQENKIIVRVSCKKRKYSYEQKSVYSKKVKSLLPPELQEKVQLLSSPKKVVANLNDSRYTNIGTWVFAIKKPEIQEKKKPARKSTTTKKQEIEKPSTTRTRRTRNKKN